MSFRPLTRIHWRLTNKAVLTFEVKAWFPSSDEDSLAPDYVRVNSMEVICLVSVL